MLLGSKRRCRDQRIRYSVNGVVVYFKPTIMQMFCCLQTKFNVLYPGLSDKVQWNCICIRDGLCIHLLKAIIARKNTSDALFFIQCYRYAAGVLAQLVERVITVVMTARQKMAEPSWKRTSTHGSGWEHLFRKVFGTNAWSTKWRMKMATWSRTDYSMEIPHLKR